MSIGFVNVGDDWSDPDKFIARMDAEATKHPCTVVTGSCGAWSVCFTKGAEKLGNVFSAKVRRSTKERDWAILGRMAARAGAPEGLMPDSIANDATATHYWIWGNEPSVQKMVDAMMGRS